MTESRNPDNRIRAWLELMPVDAPDRVIDAVLHAAETTPQVRPSLGAAWRSSPMNRIVQLLAAALIGALLVGGAVLVAGNKQQPQPSPSPQPSQTSATQAGAIPDAMFSTWMTNVAPMEAIGNGGGPISLTISSIGTPNLAVDNLQPGARFGSVIETDGSDQLKVTVSQTDSFCHEAGVVGTYKWRLSGDRTQLTLTSVSDPCAERALAIGRTWVRSLTASTNIGAGIVDAFQPFFTVALPDGAYGSRTLTDYVAIERSDHLSMSVWKNPVGFKNQCGEQTRVPYVPGAAAFVNFFKTNPAFDVLSDTPTTVSGFPAVHLVVEGRDYAPCAGQDLLQFTPVNCNCHWVSGPQVTDSF